jgi:hypothetical protein
MKSALLVALVAIMPVQGEEAGTGGAAPATVTAERPFLGVTLDPGDTFDGAPPRVSRLVPTATCDRLGVRVGDAVIAVNGRAIATLEAFAEATATLKPGDPLALTVLRDGAEFALAGKVEALPRPRDLAVDAERLRNDIGALEHALERAEMRSSLERSLLLLREFQAGLPAAAAEFKKLYPDGRFDIDIHVVISSDPKDPAPERLEPEARPDAVPEGTKAP